MQNIETQAVLRQQLYAFHKIWTQAELDIGLKLNDAAYALDSRIAG